MTSSIVRVGVVSFVVVLVGGVSACNRTPGGPTVLEFPRGLYGAAFETPAFSPGIFDGQDSWFAALGLQAATVVGRSVRAPKSGSHSLQVEGARLQELQGFHFGSYARPLSFAPIRAELPRVVIEGWLGLTAGADGPTCGNGIGLTSRLNGDPVPNILIGIQARDNAFVAYLSNFDGETVYGPSYTLGNWLHVRAVLDYERRTVQGFVDGKAIGEVPFTNGIDDEITHMNISLGSSQPIPGVNSYFDGVKVAAGPRSR